jgi:DNA end-binding protein Ku
MTKALWKGNLSLGLVNIPVRLYPEARPRKSGFTLVDRRDLSPLGVTYVNRRTGERIPSSEIARAARLPGGRRVLVPEEILDDLAGDRAHAVRIVGFTPIGDISPVHFHTPYYLEPSAEGEKGYDILMQALQRTKKAAVARVVLLHREKIAVLWPEHSMLMMAVLRRLGELRHPARLARELPPAEETGITPQEMDAALRLVGAMSIPWDPQEFRDESAERVRSWLERKAGTPAPVREVSAATPQGLLLSFLERSVKGAQEQKRAHPSRTA